jgi:putative FmdB family regulatory protein
MPIYEYRCSSCGFQNEYLQKVDAEPLAVCPECGKGTFNKLLSAAGFQLKGSGWYATDFKNSGKAKVSATKTKEEIKTESKPDDSAKSKDTTESTAATSSCSTGPCPACQ